MTKNIQFLVVTLIVVSILSLLFFFVLPSFSTDNVSVSYDDGSRDPLVEQNFNSDIVVSSLYKNDGSSVASNFSTAKSLEEQGRSYYDSARSLYENLKEKETLSADEQAHLDYRIAVTYTHSDPEKAINELKSIVTNPDYPKQQKAYAVQRMLINWHFHRSGYDVDILPTIFEGSPYSNLFVEGNLEQSLANLADYSLSFGEAPYSESRLASSKSIQFGREENIEVKSTLLVEILDHFDSIDTYFERNKNVPINASQEPRVRVNTADTMGQLAYAGIERSLEEFSSEYERAIDLNRDTPLEASLGFRYAWFAAAVEDKDGGASWTTAQPYLAKSLAIADEHQGVVRWLISRKDIPDSPSREMALILRERSPEFDAYLTANGWE